MSLRLLSEETKQKHMTNQENGCIEGGKSSVEEFVGSGCEQTGHGNGKNTSSPLLVNAKLQGSWCSRCNGILIIALSYRATL